MKVKQVIVMLKKYDMPDGSKKKLHTGKMVAQGSHASLKVILDMMSEYLIDGNESNPYGWNIYGIEDPPQEIENWIKNKFTKVCLAANSEDDMEKYYQMAKEAKLPCSKIIDAGLTEFDGRQTFTCIAIGPANSEEIDKITGHLPLL
jgi:PTH2 family peptidyl-tRNA hydrolase